MVLFRAGQPLLYLIKGVIRKFGEAAQRNRMMFVEVCLFSDQVHDANIEHSLSLCRFCFNMRIPLPPGSASRACMKLCPSPRVYPLAPGTSTITPYHFRYTLYTQRVLLCRGVEENSEDEKSVAGADSDSEDMGDELDDNADLVNVAVPRDFNKKKKEKEKKEKRSKKKRVVDADGSDEEDPVVKKRRLRKWSAEEDEVLRKLYGLYAGSSSVFNVIAQNEELT